MPISDNERKQLRSGDFLLDALRIELKPRGGDGTPFIGPGQISQSRDGKLTYTVYDTTSVKDFGPRVFPMDGTWLAENELYDFNVSDWMGRSWIAPIVVPPESLSTAGKRGVILRGDVREITCTEEAHIESGERIWIFIPGDYAVPFDRLAHVTNDVDGQRRLAWRPDLWRIDGPEYSLQVTQVDDGLEVQAYSPTALPEAFAQRIIEALWLVLARPVEWQLMERFRSSKTEFTVRCRPTPHPVPRIQPPLRFNAAEAGGHLGRMLLGYLQYIVPYDPKFIHPTSVNIRQILRASATVLETEALALGVAFESIVRRSFFNELGKPDDEFREWIVNACEHLETWSGPEYLKVRIQKSIRGFIGPTPKEAVNKLVQRGFLKPEHQTAWNRVRNPTAHGFTINEPFPELARLCDLTYQGILHLIFAIINYEGPYMDRSVEGWPHVEYPSNLT